MKSRLESRQLHKRQKQKSGWLYNQSDFIDILAGTTRLELATSGVTGRRSNQSELRPPY